MASEILVIIFLTINWFTVKLVVLLIFRLLQISSFNGKMNALNEVNKVITSVSYYTHRHSQIDDDEWLTAEKMAVSLFQ